MTTTRQRILDTLERVAQHLGDDLDSVVFVGATAAALYRTAQRIRPTSDVDLLTKANLPAYYAFRERLQKRGFQESREKNAPSLPA